MKNWKTSLFGLLAAISTVAPAAGLDFGHIGKATGMQAISAVATLLFGLYAKDNNVTGGEVKQ